MAVLCAAVVVAPWGAGARPVGAQLRPLDPLDWGPLTGGGMAASVGVALHGGVRASLAGTEGRLLELGDLRVVWGLGRSAIEISGTLVRAFEDRTVIEAPTGGARGRTTERRLDTGAVTVATSVLLVDGAGVGPDAALRFGTRLPTTDNKTGLDRDRTDFFATVAGRGTLGPLLAAGEVGLGVNGTRDPVHEQVDPLVFALRLDYTGRGGAVATVRPYLELVGQHDPRRFEEIRGTENLGEGRAGVRVGGDRWVEAWVVRGWTRLGPDAGLGVRLGARF